MSSASSSRAVSAARVAGLVGSFDQSPAYEGLAHALRLLIGDGRIGYDVRLPSERELTQALGVSRTTVARAYAVLRESGYAVARQGAGTFTRVPGGRARSHDRALLPGTGDGDLIDLNCAATSAPPGLADAYTAAAAELPAHLGGHGYFPTGLPTLQRAIAATYDDRGLPTDPDQIMVTPGALSAAAIVARAFTGPGDRVLVESPVYPNAVQALRSSGARVTGSPVDPGGWDLDAVGASLRQTAPRLAYLIPDFQNPTGHVMSDARREEYATHLRRGRTLAVVDEAHQALALEGQSMPRPFASYHRDAITLGSASKAFWGGLRLGWLRAPLERVDALVDARLALDLGAPVLEQLVLARLLADPAPILAAHRSRLREQRDVLVASVRDLLPSWRFHTPAGGLALWCELPSPRASALCAAAEQHGVIVAPGPVFAVEGGLDRFVRIPWTVPPDQLRAAAERLATAWEEVSSTDAVGTASGSGGRVMVA
ncbi:MocR-like transcription factor YczR [Nocardioides pacificus]